MPRLAKLQEVLGGGGGGRAVPHTSAVLRILVKEASSSDTSFTLAWLGPAFVSLYTNLEPVQVNKRKRGCLAVFWVHERLDKMPLKNK